MNYKNWHTKQLLNELRKMNYNAYKDLDYDEIMNIAKEIKAELATREHIPNKQEAKEIRKLKAIGQINNKNRRYVNK